MKIMTETYKETERERIILQQSLDEQKTQQERNILGQFATPSKLAHEILNYARSILPPDVKIRFIDPAFGTGSFYSALRSVFDDKEIASATAFEIDPHYAEPALQLWTHTPLELTIADFTETQPRGNHNLMICNPPYIRHHHIPEDMKRRLRSATQRASSMHLSGLAGLYGHFLGLAHPWLDDGALACWLIPSEFMDVNYGEAIKKYLLEQVNLLHIHRFDADDLQFSDALVSSCTVWFRKELPSTTPIKMSVGGTLAEPREVVEMTKEELAQLPKWSQATVTSRVLRHDQPTVGDWFRVRRGIATGNNGFFIVDEATAVESDLPHQFLRPILPPSRNLLLDQIDSDDKGLPILTDRKFLIDCRLPESVVRSDFPTLWRYFADGVEAGAHEGYLTQRRSPWYVQESRPDSPIMCTYMGRSSNKRDNPFRFIRNRSKATATNTYLLFEPIPTAFAGLSDPEAFIDRVWMELQSLSKEEVLQYGRSYGGGLLKLEPRELMNIRINVPNVHSTQLSIFPLAK